MGKPMNYSRYLSAPLQSTFTAFVLGESALLLIICLETGLNRSSVEDCEGVGQMLPWPVF